jgi:hypothetical protein
MGAFFSVIGIKQTPVDEVLSAFGKWAYAEGTGVELYQCPSGHVIGLFEAIPDDASGLAQGLAQALSTPVILFYYMDDVDWGFELYANGSLADKYTTRPGNWHSDVDPLSLAGNAAKVCEIWGGVLPQRIERYLTNKENLSEAEREALAYPDDEAEQWDAWQMCDFMKCLGLDYPIDEDGELRFEPAGQIAVATKRGLEQKAQLEEQWSKIKCKG